jgi:hypothetical protein
MTNEIPHWVLDQFGETNERKLLQGMFFLMKEANISYNELCEMPVPAIFMLMKELSELSRKERDAQRRENKR